MLIVVVVEELIIMYYILMLSAIASVVNIVLHMHMNDWYTVEFGLHNPIEQWILASHWLNGVVVCGSDLECAFSDELILWEIESCTGGIGGTGVMPWRCQPGSSLCREGSKPSGVTYGLKSSDTKRHQGGSCAPIPTDLHVTFAVHPIASNGLGASSSSSLTRCRG